MKNLIRVRKAGLPDVETIVRFNAAMALETENKSLDRKVLTKGVQALLEQPSMGYYLLAESAEGVVGQLMITYEWSDWRNGLFLWIQSVYVPTEHRGKGIYRSLYDQVLQNAKNDRNVCGIRLYVDKGNATARNIYLKCGMREAHYDMFEVDFVLE